MSLYYTLPYKTLKFIDVNNVICYIPSDSVLLFASSESPDGIARIYLSDKTVDTTNITIYSLKSLLSTLGYVSMNYSLTPTGADNECGVKRMKEKLDIETYGKNPTSRLSFLTGDVRTNILSKYMPKYEIFAVQPSEERSGDGITIYDYDIDSDRPLGAPIFRLRNTDTLPEVKIGNNFYIIVYNPDANGDYTIYEFNPITKEETSYIVPGERSFRITTFSQVLVYNDTILIYNLLSSGKLLIYQPNTQFIQKTIQLSANILYTYNINGELWFYCVKDHVNYSIYKLIDFKTGNTQKITEVPMRKKIDIGAIAGFLRSISYKNMIFILIVNKIYKYDTISDIWTVKTVSETLYDIAYDDTGFFTHTNQPSLYFKGLKGEKTILYLFDPETMKITYNRKISDLNMYVFAT